MFRHHAIWGMAVTHPLLRSLDFSAIGRNIAMCRGFQTAMDALKLPIAVQVVVAMRVVHTPRFAWTQDYWDWG